jgi:putative SOS response-associated peptidase YedK
MPVVLEPGAFGAYLDPRTNIGGFFSAASADSLTMYPVGPKVGNVRFDDPSLLERVHEATPAAAHRQLGLF